MTLTQRIKNYIDSHGYISLDHAHKMSDEMRHKQATVERTMRKLTEGDNAPYEKDKNEKNQVRGYMKSKKIILKSELEQKVANARKYVNMIDFKDCDFGLVVKDFYDLIEKAEKELKKVKPENYIIEQCLNPIRAYRKNLEKNNK